MKRAFTLIELLVVIAIIAILAAILFPVFAQAKAAAKKTAALSNMKQTATGMVMYTIDADDRLPFAMIRASGGAWQANLLAEVPTDWRLTAAATLERHSVFWANSIQPYLKNRDLFRLQDGKLRVTDAVALPGKQWTEVATVFNGLLHTYPTSSVAQPSTATLLWFGIGNVNYKGQVLSTPNLRCAGTNDCQFNPSGFPDDTNGGGSNFGSVFYALPTETTTHKIFSGGNIFVKTDTSVKFRKIGREGAGRMSDSRVDPWIEYDANGKGTTYSGCRPDGSPATVPYYWCFFRPDLEI